MIHFRIDAALIVLYVINMAVSIHSLYSEL